MAEESTTPDEKKEKPEVEAPEVGEEVLLMLERFGSIDKSSALRELQVSPETLDNWVDELERDGWVKVTDRELDDYYIGLTKESLERIKQLKELKKEEESFVEEAIEDKEPKKKFDLKLFLEKIKNTSVRFILLLRSNIIDLSLIAFFLLVVHLILAFIQDPNQRIMNFLAAIVMFSALLLIYRSYKEKLKTKTLLELVVEFFQILREKIKHIIASMFIVLLIYFAGWVIIYPEFRVISILLCTIVLTSIIGVYHPLKTKSKMLKFQIGMLLIVYSMLVIAGMASITQLIVEYTLRIVDLGMGISLLAIIYINRSFFGVEVEYFKEILLQESTR